RHAAVFLNGLARTTDGWDVPVGVGWVDPPCGSERMNAPRLPLAHLRVVAVEQAVSAPFCSRQLADLGADVVKIERPDGGDTARAYDGALNGVSAYFAWLNRGKRSVVLDLKDAQDRDACGSLIDRADIFIHNLGPGAAERL